MLNSRCSSLSCQTEDFMRDEGTAWCSMLELLLPIFGLLIGIIAALTGIGGGAFIVSLLVLVYAFVPQNAVGTSLTAIIFTAVAATLNFSRQRRIYYKTGLVLAVTTVPGASLGAYLTTILPPRLLGIILGAMLIPIALYVIADAGHRQGTEGKTSQLSGKSDSELVRSRDTMLIGVSLCFLGGLGSGLLGIGGGVLIVPIMTLAMGMPIHVATATSMFTMIFTTMSGVTQHYLASHISFEYALLLAFGTVIGAQVGAYTSKKVSSRNLRIFFGLMLIVVGIQIILKYI
jgi:uncharacterized membrane protein YfcA